MYTIASLNELGIQVQMNHKLARIHDKKVNAYSIEVVGQNLIILINKSYSRKTKFKFVLTGSLISITNLKFSIWNR